MGSSDGPETLLFFLVVGFLVWLVVKLSRSQGSKEQTDQKAASEKTRLQECGEVVSFFANTCGYIARQAISRKELEEMIDDGASAADLWAEIEIRIDDVPSINLGQHYVVDYSMPVRLPESVRDRHLYIIGKSGYGKTTLLRNMIYQDMDAGHGFGIIAPEQEMLTEEILPFVPKDRINDVIYFNPADNERPVAFNPLELDEGEDLDLRVEETFAILRRILGECGPRADQILRNSIYALTELSGMTFLDFFPLLDRKNDTLRQRVVAECTDEHTVRFFRDTYPQYPIDAPLPVLTRIGGLIRPRVVRNCLCQPHGSFKFREAMDNGKILLFNLSDGILGESASQLLGQLIVSKVQMVAMARADTPKQQRRRFYLYVDEFQTFVGTAGGSYEKLLSRARKYGVGLILAHQQTGQIPTDLRKEIFGNVSTLVSFQVSQNDATHIAKEFISEVDGEIVRAQPEDFLRLKVGEAICRIGQNSFFMQTKLVDKRPDFDRAKEVIEASQRIFGVSPRDGTKPPPADRGEPEGPEWPFADLDPEQVF